jgi:hypothetical protein
MTPEERTGTLVKERAYDKWLDREAMSYGDECGYPLDDKIIIADIAAAIREAVDEERKACAALVRSVMAEQHLADLGELLAKNIEARP